MPIGTARFAKLGIEGASLWVGESFEQDPRIQAIVADPTAALLFPSADATDLREAKPGEIRTLVVVDGTWPLARKLIRLTPSLQKLRKVRFEPSRESNYRIRAEPAAHCVSTIEAVVEAMGLLEGDVSKFTPILGAFERMVDIQIERRDARTGPGRRRIRKTPKKAKPPAVPPELLARHDDLVVVYCEANAHPCENKVKIPAEVAHLVAERLSTGERLELIRKPHRPMAFATPMHTGLSTETLEGGLDNAEFESRLRAFFKPTDLACAWGPFLIQLLRENEHPTFPLLDVRLASARVLKKRAGGIEAAGAELAAGTPSAPWAAGRAGLRIEALTRVTRHLLEMARNPQVTSEAS